MLECPSWIFLKVAVFVEFSFPHFKACAPHRSGIRPAALVARSNYRFYNTPKNKT
jgi:hypothetical protein